jgi:hypothetical protein
MSFPIQNWNQNASREKPNEILDNHHLITTPILIVLSNMQSKGPIESYSRGLVELQEFMFFSFMVS